MPTEFLTAVYILALEDWPDDALAAVNLALTLGDHVPPINCGFQRAVDDKLIKESGLPWDDEAVKLALSQVINRRVEAGTWGTQVGSDSAAPDDN